MARGVNEDPLKVFRFGVEHHGFKRGGFRDVQGLEATTEVAEYREGGDNESVKKSASLTSYGNLTLMRGQIIGSDQGGEDDLLEWARQVRDVAGRGTAANYRRDIEITQYGSEFEVVRRWAIDEAWPVRFKLFGDLSATGNDNSIEELELAHEGFAPV